MKKMAYRTFGKTGLAIPVFSLGLIRSMKRGIRGIAWF
jgi:predicted aldo/keto reductase-like oxidoreductase